MSAKKIFVPGLKALKVCWLIGAIIAILSYFCAIIVSGAGGYPIRRGSWDGNGNDACICKEQLKNRNEHLIRISSDLAVVKKRIESFKEGLYNTKNTAFIQSRMELDREKKEKTDLEAEKKRLILKPIFPSAAWELALILFGLVAVFLVARFVLKDAQDTFHEKLNFKKVWIRP